MCKIQKYRNNRTYTDMPRNVVKRAHKRQELGWGSGDGQTKQMPSPSRVVWAQYCKSVDLNPGCTSGLPGL